jgi:hypothetical protein
VRVCKCGVREIERERERDMKRERMSERHRERGRKTLADRERLSYKKAGRDV